MAALPLVPVAAAQAQAQVEPVRDLYFKRHQLLVMRHIGDTTQIAVVLLPIIAGYVTVQEEDRPGSERRELFGRAQWWDYLGVDVGEEPQLDPYELYRFLFGPDPINGQPRCETHYPPVLRPQTVSYPAVCCPHCCATSETAYSLGQMKSLFREPRKGLNFYYGRENGAHAQLNDLSADGACWVVARIVPVDVGMTYGSQAQTVVEVNQRGATHEDPIFRDLVGYDPVPSSIDLTTIIAVRNLFVRVDGEPMLSRCQERLDGPGSDEIFDQGRLTGTRTHPAGHIPFRWGVAVQVGSNGRDLLTPWELRQIPPNRRPESAPPIAHTFMTPMMLEQVEDGHVLPQNVGMALIRKFQDRDQKENKKEKEAPSFQGLPAHAERKNGGLPQGASAAAAAAAAPAQRVDERRSSPAPASTQKSA